MSNPSGFTWQSWEDTQEDYVKSQMREESEQTWLESFMEQAEEIDIEFKQLKEELK